jgi:hypothetical protein
LGARSHGGGAHFDAPRPLPQLPDPHVNADIIRMAPQTSASEVDMHRLLFSNPVGSPQLRNLTVPLPCENDGRWCRG